MSLDLIGSLIALALVDSTSFGTLLIPVLMVLASRRVAWRPMLVYLGTVVAFYFVLGVGLVFGLDAAISALDRVVSDRVALYLQLGFGLALLIGSFFVDRFGRGRDRRARLAGVTENPRAMMVLALSATAVEAASMVPYLAAIGILSASDVARLETIPILFGYCLIMIVPAILLLVVVGTVGGRVWARLERFGSSMERSMSGALGWVVGIVGFFVVSNAASRLWFQ